MAFNKGSLGANQNVKEYTDGLEGRIDSAFGEVETNSINLDSKITKVENETKQVEKDTLSLLGDWNNVGTSFGLARVNKNNSVVSLSGLIKGGSVGSNIATLPSKYRFSHGIKRFTVASRTTATVTTIEISSGGVIKLLSGDTENVDLSSICYVID